MIFMSAIFVSWLGAVIGFFLDAKPVVYWAYGLVDPLLIFLAGSIASRQRFAHLFSERWKVMVRRFIILFLTLNIPGSVYLHDLGIQYDRFLHFSIGFLLPLFLLILAAPFARHGIVFKKLDKAYLLNILTPIALAFLGIWEGIQWSIDRIFGTQLYHDAVQMISRDVTEDLVLGGLGVLLAFVYANRVKLFWKAVEESAQSKS